MAPWFTTSLGDATLALEPLDRLEAGFLSTYGTAGDPPEAAVFFRHESEGHLHCDLRVYFSPATEALARSLGAEACGRPSPQDLSLLAGSEAAWGLLFPDWTGRR